MCVKDAAGFLIVAPAFQSLYQHDSRRQACYCSLLWAALPCQMWTAVFIQRAGFIDLRSVSSLTLLLLFLWQLGISPEVGSRLLPVVIRDLSCLESVCFFLSTSVGVISHQSTCGDCFNCEMLPRALGMLVIVKHYFLCSRQCAQTTWAQVQIW